MNRDLKRMNYLNSTAAPTTRQSQHSRRRVRSAHAGVTMVTMKRRWVSLLCIALLGSAASAQITVSRVTLAPGVTVQRVTGSLYAAPQSLHYLYVDPRLGARIEARLGKDVVYQPDATQGREAVNAFSARTGAVAAINADFFPWTGDPLSLMIRNGELLSEPMQYRASFGIGPSGEWLFGSPSWASSIRWGATGTRLSGINRYPGTGELVLMTAAAGVIQPKQACLAIPLRGASRLLPGQPLSFTAGAPYANPPYTVPEDGMLLLASGEGRESVASLAEGAQVTIQIDLIADTDAAALTPDGRRLSPSEAVALWSRAVEAISGGPKLISDGQVVIGNPPPIGYGLDLTGKRHPRTAIGVTADGRCLLAVTDGRQPLANGLSLPELAQLMRQAGAVEAINLDGGGSSMMATITGFVLNQQSDASPRPVANLVAVYHPSAPTIEPLIDDAVIHPFGAALPPNALRQYVVASERCSEPPDEAPVMWSSNLTAVTATLEGLVSTRRVGTGQIRADVGGVICQTSAEVRTDVGSRLQLDKRPTPADPSLTLRLVDAAGKPRGGVPVIMAGVGAAPASDVQRSAADGAVSFRVSVPSGSVVTFAAESAILTLRY